MKDRDTEIIGVVAPNRKIDAVYYDDETKSLIRNPVVAIVITNTEVQPKTGQDERDFWENTHRCGELLSVDPESVIDCVEASNFLGLEFDGEKKDWTEVIEKRKEREELGLKIEKETRR